MKRFVSRLISCWSLPFIVFAAAVQAQEPRLANLSTRGFAGTGDNVLTVGFFIGAGPNKQIMIRAVGPGLANVGIPNGLLADPVLTLFNGERVQVATNDNWLAADATAMGAAGAFGLTPGSRDAAIITTLAPGLYTAQVAGAGNTTGLALVEVYELGSTGARFTNVSTRARVGTGDELMIPALSVSGGGGPRKFLVRAIGPWLKDLGLADALEDPTISVVNPGGSITYAANNDWGTPVGNGISLSAMTAAMSQAGAFPLKDGSKDAAVVVDLAPGNYSVLVSGVGGTSGIALVEIYDITPAGPPTVTIAATVAAADKSGSKPGEYTFTRTGDTSQALVVNYVTGGTAVNGFDYPALLGKVTIPAGAASVKLPLTPNPAVLATGGQTATLTIATGGTSYVVGNPSSATVNIADSPATLYVSNLRPEATATGSSASGTATILINKDGTLANVSVAFSGLSSAQTGAQLRIAPSGDYVFALPLGQVSNVLWTLAPTGTYTRDDLIKALNSGNIYVGLNTAANPTGEVRGSFIVASGAQDFTPPTAPPALPAGTPTAADAARFLAQATFGPLRADIADVQARGFDAWITAQMALPNTSHRTATQSDFRTFGGSSVGYSPNNRVAAWWKISLTAPDQLRQRVAFALSQIFVVSDVQFDIEHVEGLANYYDMLANGAFGSFRTLLENVSRSPIMGTYLSSLRNSKADLVAGTSPDENYAREVMQLFTVGLNLLRPDGTLKLDAAGLPIPAYSQNTVTEMAKVFTGWSYFSTKATPSFRGEPADFINPMQLFAAFHDDGAKNIINGVVLPPGQGGAKDLQQALDALVQHPNTGPFIAKQLIQRLVTSNPTPAYVYRVAQKFGLNGDLGAVVRAILTDYEARSTTTVASANFGKLREPIIRTTGILRTFGATSASGRYVNNLLATQVQLAQAPLRAPTVFNFYHPDYVLPGALASAGLVAPEFEITDAAYSISAPNLLRTFVFNTAGTNPDSLVLDLTYEQTLAGTPSALLDHLNLMLCGGSMSQAVRDRVTTMLASLPAATTSLERVQRAILVLVTTPAGAVQK